MASVKEMQNVGSRATRGFAAVLGIFIVTSGAPVTLHAAEISVEEAQKAVTSAEQHGDQLVTKLPALKDITDVVAGDCAMKLPVQSKMPGFCRCGAAVTLELWRSNADGGTVLGKLKAYVAAPSAAGAAEFLKYQGPELYRPLCERALGAAHG